MLTGIESDVVMDTLQALRADVYEARLHPRGETAVSPWFEPARLVLSASITLRL
jgi:hypothetical protein